LPISYFSVLKNYYQILDISTDAEAKVIRKAWLRKVQKHHPDHNPDDPTAEEQFIELQEAYRVLSDPFLRNRYDLGLLNATGQQMARQASWRHYFYSHSAFKTIKLYEELHVTFTYSGQGRVFKKPLFTDFFVTGSPYVSHRMVIQEGVEMKETTFTYVLCPLKTGKIEIEAATIRINNVEFRAEPLPVQVALNKCHFTENEPADGKPLKFPLHFAQRMEHTSEKKKNHTLLIPRSKTARTFHQIGSTMKLVFLIWGGVVFPLYFNMPFLVGCLAGSFLG
jgi:hypothetical protein